jgi:antibiotic biosynthesis monooxygenase (ABM) superfamily enzyme
MWMWYAAVAATVSLRPGGSVFVTVSSFRVRPGEEDAVVALHEDWMRTLRHQVPGFVSGELLSDRATPLTFLRITRFADENAARTAERNREHAAWARRLASLTSERLESVSYDVAWAAT